MTGKGNVFAQEYLYLYGMFSYINERYTSSPDCMLENGAPPDKFGALYRLLHIEFYVSNSRIDVSELAH